MSSEDERGQGGRDKSRSPSFSVEVATPQHTPKRQALRASLNSAVIEQQELLLELGELRAERKRFVGVDPTEASTRRLGEIGARITAAAKEVEELDSFIKGVRQAIDHDEWCLRKEAETKTAPDKKTDSQLRLPEARHFPQYRSGSSDQPANLAMWFRDVKRVLEDHFIPAERHVAALALLLPEGQPKEWVYEFRERYPRCSWEVLTAAYERHFTRVATVEQLEMEFDSLRQGAGSVFEYWNQFNRLARGCGIDIDSERTRRQFRRYLKPELQRELKIIFGKTIDEQPLPSIFETCHGLESSVYSGAGSAAERTKGDKTKDAQETKGGKDQKGLVCHECGKPGHRRGDKVCPDYVPYGRTGGKSGDGGSSKEGEKKDEKKEKKGFWGKCHHCGEVGHRSFECPAKKKPSSKDE